MLKKRKGNLIFGTQTAFIIYFSRILLNFCSEHLPWTSVRLKLIVTFPKGIPVSLSHTQVWQSREKAKKPGKLWSKILSHPCHSPSSLAERKCILGFIEMISIPCLQLCFRCLMPFLLTRCCHLRKQTCRITLQNHSAGFYSKHPTEISLFTLSLCCLVYCWLLLVNNTLIQ